MIKILKSQIKNIVFLISKILFKTKIGRIAAEKFLNLSMNNFEQISHGGCKLKFINSNWITNIRIKTFSTKEPETLKWIDNINEKEIFWDIGANIGLYSCYAAKKNKCNVYAFEPSVFNIELLARNIYINNLSDKIRIISLPLTEKILEAKFNMSNTDLGSALSTFGKDYTHDGSKLKINFDFKTIGISIDQTINFLKVPSPDFIKMDVDGIEHLILQGGQEALKKVKSILIEIDESFEAQKQNSTKFLSEAGFKFVEKHPSSSISDGYKTCFNQIWSKKN